MAGTVYELAQLAKAYLELWRIAEVEGDRLLADFAAWRRGEIPLLDLIALELLESHFIRAGRPPRDPKNRERWERLINRIVTLEARIMTSATRRPPPRDPRVPIPISPKPPIAPPMVEPRYAIR